MRHRRLLMLSTATAALLMVVTTGELALRMFPELMPVQWQLRNNSAQGGETFVVRADDELGYLLPVSAGTDRYGFPNAEPWPQHTSLVFLGDSLLSGFGVGNAASFPQLIARQLPHEPVLNLGLAAAGPERQYLIYRRFGRELRPRLVIAGLYLAADFENDAAFRAWRREPNATPFLDFRGVFGAIQQGGYEPYIDWQTALKTLQIRRLVQKLRLYIRARDLIQGMLRPYPDRFRAPDGTDVVMDEFALAFAAEPAARHDARIDALLESLGNLRDLVATQGGELLVMLIPSKEELFGVPLAVTNDNVVARTRERLREAGFSVLDLYPALSKAAEVAFPFFGDDIHLSAYGNKIVADEFVAWFRTHGPAQKQ